MNALISQERMLEDLSRDAYGIVTTLYPKAVLNGPSLRIGNADGEPGSSMSITVKGTHAGKFIDFAPTDPELEKGHIIRLIKHKLGLRSNNEVARWYYNDDVKLERSVRPAEGFEKKTEDVPLAFNRKPNELCRRIFEKAKAELKHTPVAHYLLCRGVKRKDERHEKDVLEDIRYDPESLYKADDHPEGIKTHGLLGAMRNLNGDICGLLRIFLKSSGSKADVKYSKKTLGEVAGCGLYMGDPTETVIAGEGFENTRKCQQFMGKKYQAIAMLTTSGMKNFIFPDYVKRVIIACDNDEDWQGVFAAAKLEYNHRDRDIEFFPIIPTKEDWDDEDRMLGSIHCRELATEQILEQLNTQ